MDSSQVGERYDYTPNPRVKGWILTLQKEPQERGSGGKPAPKGSYRPALSNVQRQRYHGSHHRSSSIIKTGKRS